MVSQLYRGQCCRPWAWGAHYVLQSAHPALLERIKTHCQGTCLSLTLCETSAAAPCAITGLRQQSEGPLGYQGSRPGPGPSLSSDFRGASRASPRSPCCLRPPQPWSRWRGWAGDSPRETPTQYKPQRVNNYGCDCSGTSAFPRALTVKRSCVKAEGRRGRRDARGDRSGGRSGTPWLGAAMGDVFIRHIELLGYEKRFFPSQHYVSMQRPSDKLSSEDWPG